MTLDSDDSTTLGSGKPYFSIDQSGFGEVMILRSVDSTIWRMFQLIIMRIKLLSVMIIVMTHML